ncbi:replication protein A [Mute swan feces associated circular virus 4]|nr:replication protein A [Mute swan feces associated circular virus 4]
MANSSYAKNWIYTLNNPTEDENLFHALHGESIANDPDSPFTYLCFGEEVGAEGTPHLQGYFTAASRQRISTIKLIPGFERVHLEVRRGSHKQASDYCKKEGKYHEYGAAATVGNQASFEALRDWVAMQDPAPTIADVWEAFPTLAARYRSACIECISLFGKRPVLADGPLRLWQQRVDSLVSADPDDRKIIFVVDPDGNQGKSWLCRYWISKRGGTQFLSVGKRDDLAFTIDISNDLFVFDIPRGNLQYLQYGILEGLKNQLLFSPKYNSCTKMINHKVHVVVFTNEQPDMTALTADRYKVIVLGGSID